MQGIVKVLGRGVRLQVIPSSDGIHGSTDALIGAIDEETALVTLSHTTFKSSFTYDMNAVNQAAHRFGALTLWDLSHSAGSLAVELTRTKADLAVGCTYKYLNGGPGAPAFMYIRRELQSHLSNPISGWIGQHDPFGFSLDYSPAPGLHGFLTGTPPILSLMAVEPGVDLLLEAGIETVRERSVRMSQYLVALVDELLLPHGFRLNSPRDARFRGSHISLGHDEGARINLSLIRDMNVLPDFRRPDNIRFGIAPLYNTFAELFTAVERLRTVVSDRLYERHDPTGLKVT